jgi:hypothetical protein
MIQCVFHHGFKFEPTTHINVTFYVETVSVTTTKVKSFNFQPTMSMRVMSTTINTFVMTTKETTMDTFKQFLQRRAATKRE